jgi:hypothetical protein
MKEIIMFGYKISNKGRIYLSDIIRLLCEDLTSTSIVSLDIQCFDMSKEMTELDEHYMENDTRTVGVGSIHSLTDVVAVMDKFDWHSNLVWEVPANIPDDEKGFLAEKWRWCYFCADASWVEIFTQYEKLGRVIENEYDVERIAFPGSIYTYMDPRNWD